MPAPDPVRDDLTVHAGRAFGPYGWVLRDPETGLVLRDPAGLTARARIKAHPRAVEVLAEFTAEVVALRIPGDELPVAAVMLRATAGQTLAMVFRTGVYDVLVDRADQANPPAAEGRVRVVAAVSG